MRPAFGALGSLLAMALVTSGCVGSSSSANGTAKQYVDNGTMTIALDDDLGGFDPYVDKVLGRAYLAYDPLVFLKPDGKFVPGLAEKWSVDANSSTFTLRQGVTCSDGAPLTASDVAADIKFAGDPKNQSPEYGQHMPTVPFTVKADDTARTVTVDLKKPFGFILNTIGQLPIVCGKGAGDRKSLKTASDGTGPFVLTSVVPGQSYMFTVRKGYTWGPDGASTSAPGTPAKVVLNVLANMTTRANLLMSGGLNVAAVKNDDEARLDAQHMHRFDQAVAGNWLWFNQLGGRPTADRRVRQALIQALDLNQVVKVNTGGRGGAATGLVSMNPSPCPGNPVAGRLPGHDVAAANNLLDQAGWAKGPDGIRQKGGKPLTVNLHYVAIASDYNRPTAELLAQVWKAVGVKVTLTTNTWVTASQDMFKNSNYDVYTTGFGFSFPSQAVSFMTGPTPPKGTNFTGMDNQDYIALAAKAAALTPPQACPYWHQAEQALYREVNPVPIANRPVPYYLSHAVAQTAGDYVPVIPTSLRLLK